MSGVVSVFSIIVMALAADMISQTSSDAGFYFNFDAFAVAVSVITWTSLTAMYVTSPQLRIDQLEY